MAYSYTPKMFDEEVCACMSCLDVPVGSAQLHKNQLQESVLATRYLSVSLRATDIPATLVNERPLSNYHVAPLIRLEDEWLRAEGISA